jgi:hypothetical protein
VRLVTLIALLITIAACDQHDGVSAESQLNSVAERYVRLALALGEHDEDYVDAYFGPADWRESARANPVSLQEIVGAAEQLAARARAIDIAAEDPLMLLRQDFLASHLESLAAIARMRDGEPLTFDQESKAVYGFVAPTFATEYYAQALAEIDALLPGDKPLHERVYAFRQQFRVPRDKVEAIVRASIDECRARTLARMDLPEGESFELEMVTGQPWGAYNWYLGNGQGLIQVEASRPKSIGSSIRLSCHEGYPGHHTFSTLLDYNFRQARNWVEFSVLPLFSPQGIIFEGSGDIAARVAFPGASRNAFLRDTIMPIAGIESADLEAADRLGKLTRKIQYAGIEAARKYLDGDWDRAQTQDWLLRYALVAPEDIDAWFAFTDRYRAYNINYVLGEDLVAAYMRRENPDGDNDGDWRALAKLLSLPPTPLLFKDLDVR